MSSEVKQAMRIFNTAFYDGGEHIGGRVANDFWRADVCGSLAPFTVVVSTVHGQPLGQFALPVQSTLAPAAAAELLVALAWFLYRSTACEPEGLKQCGS